MWVETFTLSKSITQHIIVKYMLLVPKYKVIVAVHIYPCTSILRYLYIFGCRIRVQYQRSKLEEIMPKTLKIFNLGLLNDTSKRICSDAPDAKVTCRFTLATHICTKKVCLLCNCTGKVAVFKCGYEKKAGVLLCSCTKKVFLLGGH